MKRWVRPQHVDPRHWDAVAAHDEAMVEASRTQGTAERQATAVASWSELARMHRRWAIEARRELCGSCVEPVLERRPVNGLCVEIGSPAARCKLKSPDGRGLAWLLSGGSVLAYGLCRMPCPWMPGE